MKIFGKSKTAKKTVSKKAEPETPELLTLVKKIVERLDILEQRIELVVRQTSGRPAGGGGHSQPVQQPSQGVKPVVPQQGVPKTPQGPRQKPLHQAVCADCKKDCEIPFKPSGDRPVYCKECFAKRKAARQAQGNIKPQPPRAPLVPQSIQRQVSVTKKGVGKVTVSEIVPSVAQETSFGKKGRSSGRKTRS